MTRTKRGLRRLRKTSHGGKTRRTSHRYRNKKTRTGGRTTRSRRTRRGGKRRVRQRGGVAYTPTLSLPGKLPGGNSAYANPPPHETINNCRDNYNHYKN